MISRSENEYDGELGARFSDGQQGQQACEVFYFRTFRAESRGVSVASIYRSLLLFQLDLRGRPRSAPKINIHTQE